MVNWLRSLPNTPISGSAAALLIVVLGFILRLRLAAQYYLNPDELQNFYLALPASWKELYLATAEAHHPPLLFFVLHGVIAISPSELAMRLLPAAAGSLAGWVFYRWMTAIGQPGAGWAGLLILTLSPNLITLGAEVRAYTFLLLFAVLALRSLDAALDARSARGLLIFTAWLYLAILCEYSAAWWAGGAALYFLLRARAARLPVRLWLVWAAGQAGALATYAALYITSIRPLLAESAHLSDGGYLRNAFPQGDASLLVFAFAATARQFVYAFSSPYLGALGAVLFVAGLALLWSGRGNLELARGRCLAVLLVAPFVLACGAAIVRVHPYTASRHTVILVLPIAVGAGVAAEKLLGSRTRLAALSAAAALLAIWLVTAKTHPFDIAPPRHSLVSMRAATQFIRSHVPPGSVLLVEGETEYLMRYYLAGPYSDTTQEARERIVIRRADPFRLAASRFYQWPDAAALKVDAAEVRRVFKLAANEPVWILDGGWQMSASEMVTGQPPGLTLPGYRTFDQAITVFQLPPAFR